MRDWWIPFELEMSDGFNRVSFLVAVLVEGVNDQPVADSLMDLPGSLYSTAEDEILVVQHPGVLENDLEADINSEGIDDKKMIIPVEEERPMLKEPFTQRFLSKVQPPAAWSMIQVDLLSLMRLPLVRVIPIPFFTMSLMEVICSQKMMSSRSP